MTDVSAACTQCGLSDKTYKVSLLYLEASERLSSPASKELPQLHRFLNDYRASTGTTTDEKSLLTGLIKALSPPSGERRVTRRLHPDLTVTVFGLLAAMVLYRIGVDQPGMFYYAVLIFVVVLVLYVATRKKVIRKYHAWEQTEQNQVSQVSRAVDLWMQSFLCSRDQVVFIPGRPGSAPLEQLRSYLREA
jgi:hypothetical protein